MQRTKEIPEQDHGQATRIPRTEISIGVNIHLQLLTRQALSTQSPPQTSPFQSTKNVYTRTMSRKRFREATVCILGSFLPPYESSQ